MREQSLPILRRCGWAVVEVYPPLNPGDPPRWGWACFGPLPCDPHTVPRSKMTAVLMALRFSDSGPLQIWSDHLNLVRGYDQGAAQQSAKEAANDAALAAPLVGR